MKQQIINTKFTAYLLVLFLALVFAVFLYLVYIYYQNSFQSAVSKVSESKNLASGCRERIHGLVEIKNPSPDSKVLIVLSYSTGGGLHEKSVSAKGGSYSINVFGKPDLGATWSLSAYHYDKNGQISETAQDISGIECDQEINLDLSL